MSRNILAPSLMQIGDDRCYRINRIHEDFQTQFAAANQQQNNQIKQVYNETDLYGEDYIDFDAEDDDEDAPIEEVGNSKFILKMHVAPSFYGTLIGHRGATIRRIEAETQVELVIPSRKQPNNDATTSKVIIQGNTRNAVATARHKVNLLIASYRKRLPGTHFYGVALNTGEIPERYKIFKEQVLSANLSAGIEPKLFKSDCSLHLTFGACVLMDAIERKKAAQLLQNCREFTSGIKTPIKIHVKGLEIMNDDPSAVRVLYANVESEDLQIFANRCYEYFNKSVFAKQNPYQRDDVKLHMSVMNTSLLKNDSSPNTVIQPFDAREILKGWSDFDFGQQECNELILCAIGSSSDTHFYKISETVKFS